MKIEIEGEPHELAQLAVTIRDGLFWQKGDAAEDGQAFDPMKTFDWRVADDIAEQVS